MNDDDDDEIDQEFLRSKRRRSTNVLPILGIMIIFMAPGLFAAFVYMVQSNKDVPIPEEVVQHQRQDRHQIIPPAKNMGEVYGRLVIYGGVALVAFGGMGIAIYQGISSQQRRTSSKRKTSTLTVIQWTALYTIPLLFMAMPSAYYIAHHNPVFGGIIVAMAQPYSPARESVVPIHMFAFGLAGVAIGTILGVLTWLSRR